MAGGCSPRSMFCDKLPKPAAAEMPRRLVRIPLLFLLKMAFRKIYSSCPNPEYSCLTLQKRYLNATGIRFGKPIRTRKED